MKKLVFVLAAFFTTAAFADQCQWNSYSNADSAKKLIKGNDIMMWCQNCRESLPSEIFKVESVKTTKPEKGFNELEVTVNYQGKVKTVVIDLAYTYVRTASDQFANVAQLVNCPNTGAVTFVESKQGGVKVAHYYSGRGANFQRHDVATTKKEVKIADWKAPAFDENAAFEEKRMPASFEK